MSVRVCVRACVLAWVHREWRGTDAMSEGVKDDRGLHTCGTRGGWYMQVPAKFGGLPALGTTCSAGVSRSVRAG